MTEKPDETKIWRCTLYMLAWIDFLLQIILTRVGIFCQEQTYYSVYPVAVALKLI